MNRPDTWPPKPFRPGTEEQKVEITRARLHEFEWAEYHEKIYFKQKSDSGMRRHGFVLGFSFALNVAGLVFLLWRG